MPFKGEPQPVFYHRSLVSAGAAYDDVDIERVDPGYILLVLQAKAVNKSNDFTRVDIGIVDLGIFELLYSSTTPSQNVVYGLHNPFMVSEGEFLRVRFTGNTANDSYELYVQGLLYPLK